jgi:inner membrane protein
MDNITHSLIGYALGKSLQKDEASQETTSLNKAILLTSILGNNLPDADFIFDRTLTLLNFNPLHPSLNYLLHHRGFTHSLWLYFPLGFLAAFLGSFFSKTKLNTQLVLVGLLSVFTHVFADFWNNYGVHPFSPISNQWFYGDAIFIIEPLICFSLIPYAFFKTPSKKWKTLLFLLLLIAYPLMIRSGMVEWSTLAFLSVFLFVQICLQYGLQSRLQSHYQHRYSLTFAWGSLSLILALFFSCSFLSKVVTKNQVTRQFTDQRIVDVLATSGPSQFLNWKNWVILQNIHRPNEVRYILMDTSLIQQSSQLVEERQIDLTEFKRLKDTYCSVRLYLYYSRLPFYTLNNDGTYSFMDLRYSSTNRNIKRGIRFSEMLINPTTENATDCFPQSKKTANTFWKSPTDLLFGNE